jgi:hypothetical protein
LGGQKASDALVEFKKASAGVVHAEIVNALAADTSNGNA